MKKHLGRSILLFLFLLCTIAQAADELRLIETPTSIAKIMSAEHPGIIQFVSYADTETSLILIQKNAIGLLAKRSHEITGRCGGFIDLTNESPSARIYSDESEALAATLRPPLPTLDEQRPEIVHALKEVRPPYIERFVKIYSTQFKTRSAESAEGATASAWLRSQWLQMAKDAGREDIEVDLVAEPRGYSQSNVRITIPGQDSSAPIVILGAHLDSINRSDGFDSTAPGADDDASGISALTETYRILLGRNFRPKATIQLFGYAAEELGLLGSRTVAELYQDNEVQVRGVLQLDMVAWPGSSHAVTFIVDHVDKALTIWTEQLYGLYVGAEIKEDRCGYACSDHASWHRYGFASVMPFESPKKEMNNRIHTSKDVWDDRLNSNFAAQYVKLALAFAMELSN